MTLNEKITIIRDLIDVAESELEEAEESGDLEDRLRWALKLESYQDTYIKLLEMSKNSIGGR